MKNFSWRPGFLPVHAPFTSFKMDRLQALTPPHIHSVCLLAAPAAL